MRVPAAFSWLDWLIIAGYFVIVALLSYIHHHKKVDEVEFLLSGRRLTLPAFVATLVSTWYGGILGVGEYSYQFGISMWLVFGIPFYVFSLIYAWLLADKIRKHPAYSIPEALRMQYGSRAGKLSALFVFLLVSPAPYILMLGLLFQYLSGSDAPFLWYAVGVALFSTLYVSIGGFDAVVRTDFFQLIMMYLGFILLVIFSIQHAGGPATLWQKLPEIHRSWTGGHSIQYIVVWFFIALWTFVDPAFHQRVAAARTPAIARRGIMLSVLCWMLFDTLTLLSGLYGYHILGAIDQPTMVYPYLANFLFPIGLKGLFFVALLATIMSTLDSYLFLSGQTLGRDFLAHYFPRIPSIRLIRISIFAAAMLGILLLMLYPSVISLWYVIGSIMVPGLLIPLLGVYLPAFRIRANWVLAQMIFPTLAALIWLILGEYTATSPYLGIEPFYPGLLVSVLSWMLGKKPYKQKAPHV